MNKAAERLRRWDCVDESEFSALLDEALAAERKIGFAGGELSARFDKATGIAEEQLRDAERRATVERIRAALDEPDPLTVRGVLDAEAGL